LEISEKVKLHYIKHTTYYLPVFDTRSRNLDMEWAGCKQMTSSTD